MTTLSCRGVAPNPARELLATLDRGLMCEHLDALADEDLLRLEGLLEHWRQLVELRLERRDEVRITRRREVQP